MTIARKFLIGVLILFPFEGDTSQAADFVEGMIESSDFSLVPEIGAGADGSGVADVTDDMQILTGIAGSDADIPAFQDQGGGRNALGDGVLDPMQVVLNSLESAVSIASLVLMTDAAIIAPSD